MPPPLPRAYGQAAPHGSPEGTVDAGAARFPVTTLSLIVTVAPRPPSAAGGTSMPPPNASGLELLTPPVIVTPLIVTVGSVPAPSSPIVNTGPPPLITVEPAPEPSSLTLASIVIPPANTPGPMWITSPSCAASTAA